MNADDGHGHPDCKYFTRPAALRGAPHYVLNHSNMVEQDDAMQGDKRDQTDSLCLVRTHVYTSAPRQLLVESAFIVDVML